MKRQMGIYFLLILLPFLVVNCIEPFEPEAVDFESALVIEATITDENKNQEILVSRTFALDTTGLYGERGAQVSVTDTNGDVYDFVEAKEGKYVSSISFAAQTGVGYSLSINTKDGSTYSSEQVIATQPTKIDSLYTEINFKDGEVNEGIFVYVDSVDPTKSNEYYRYVYEETYKIIAPYWSPLDAYVISRVPFDYKVGTFDREQYERICYNTVISKDVIQIKASNFIDNRISKFSIRFINRDNWILANRYSILVKQYVESRAAYNYYDTLKSLSDSESSLYQIQTGFLEGNIHSVTYKNENVVGYFQVSSVSEKRIFFDYEDYFPGEESPGYESECELLTPNLNDIGGGSYLATGIDWDLFTFYEENGDKLDSNHPFVMASPNSCGDCTVLGSNVKPDFWVED
ncbi:DUF4249 domain-containing protein [Maribacter sp. ACAM166]|uniref:DUF4249 domain-containing protein n=1 Tax=Maribacter sp. ACAM166 TaxID=2508996 RepID=UPI0010FF25B6|nr:DUF4249 domain-containing protein [Maribacter sp. ACAM166]TLP79806.1 DUF4249 domain-containing protein [Maribacter sp. ACAM166]